jgi:murein L,D-transpeptidase YcbB/YkuD
LAVDAQLFNPPKRPEIPEIEEIFAELGPAAYSDAELKSQLASVEPASIHEAVRLIYERENGAFMWSDGLFLTAAGHRLVQLVSQCEDHGIRSQSLRAGFVMRVKGALDWNLNRLKHLQPSDTQRTGAIRLREMLVKQIDIQLTATALAFARFFDLTSLSGKSLARIMPPYEEREEWIKSMAPWHPQYWRLVKAMSRYRRYSKGGAFDEIRHSRELARIVVGAHSNEVLKLRKRLRAEGFLRRTKFSDKMIFTDDLKTALQVFQYTRGLSTHGRFDRVTAKAMNVPLSRLLHRLRRAMRRWRRSVTRKESTFIQVNLPEYAVEFYENRERILRHKAVIGYAFGTGGGRTKQFHSEINEIVMNPSWMPSDNIVQNELLPKEQQEPGYLARKGFHWTTRANGKKALFQSPGPKSALGRVLLHFPNKNNIYLHGSPDESQFSQAYRAKSHGCVRVQGIEELAIYLLERDGLMSGEDFWAHLKARQPRSVALRQPVPIHFEYVLVAVDDNGYVRFLPNVYKR